MSIILKKIEYKCKSYPYQEKKKVDTATAWFWD
jgi:hypothetical protein